MTEPKNPDNLGEAYLYGRGVEANPVEAVKWYHKSADQGYSKAQLQLGGAYLRGDGVETNLLEAVKWYRASAEAGDSKAQYFLGLLYHKGVGVEKSYSEAIKWFQKSAEQGDLFSAFLLAEMYEEGRGVSKNHDLALQWYRKAAEAGHPDAKAKLDSFDPPSVKYEKTLAWEKARASGKTELDVFSDMLAIDAAKRQWAQANNRGQDATPTEDDLKVFLYNNVFPIHPPGGQYIINAVGQQSKSTVHFKGGN